MTPDETKKMFRFAAELRKIPPCDPRYEQGRAVLDAMNAKFKAENMVEREPTRANDSVSWQNALEYLATVFQALDEQETDANNVMLRRAAWETISDAVQTFYQDPDLEQARQKLAKMKAEANRPEQNS